MAKKLGRVASTIRDVVNYLGVEKISQGQRLLIRTDDFGLVESKVNEDYVLKEIDWRACGIKEWEMGWLAGIIDGEGHIQVLSSPNARYVRSAVELCNTGVVVIEKAAQIIGKLGLEFSKLISNVRRLDRFKPLHKLRLKSMKDSWSFIKVLYPFLVLKRRDADILIKFYEIKSKNAGRLEGTIAEEGKKLSAEMQECRKDLNRGLEAISN
jgi:hypothetical protein